MRLQLQSFNLFRSVADGHRTSWYFATQARVISGLRQGTTLVVTLPAPHDPGRVGPLGPLQGLKAHYLATALPVATPEAVP